MYSRCNWTTFSAPWFNRVTSPFAHGRLAWSQAILDVTLEDNTVAFSETEGFIDRLQCIAIGCEGWEDSRVDWATFVVDDLECALRVLGHGNAWTGENTVWSWLEDTISITKYSSICSYVMRKFQFSQQLTVFWNFNAEGKTITDTDSFNFAAAGIQDANTWWWSLWRWVDVNHFWIAVIQNIKQLTWVLCWVTD